MATDDLLFQYQKLVESKIQQSISSFCKKDRLRDACEYALMNGGKRLRPILALMVAEAVGHQADVTQAALSVEFFHTASLVADDLPCMDDDDERRQKPSIHKVYGEALALLVSYALIAAGYAGIAANGQMIKESFLSFSHHSDRLVSLALENATHNTGLQGATGGQFLDIFPPDLSLKTLREVIHKKTVSLFEVAFVFGWLFGGGNLEALSLVKKAAAHFGMAFQIADDIGDLKQDALNERKVNIAAILGEKTAQNMLCEERQGYLSVLKELKIDSPELISVGGLLSLPIPKNTLN
jgi:geranylgeranyl diphosphate synthase type II